MEATASREIRWNQVLALLALDLAIIISWIAYNKYQPELLVQFKLVDFGIALAVVQGFILFITPPVAGYFADRMRKNGGTRLPVITIGINFVSMVFMVVALTVFADPNGASVTIDADNKRTFSVFSKVCFIYLFLLRRSAYGSRMCMTLAVPTGRKIS